MQILSICRYVAPHELIVLLEDFALNYQSVSLASLCRIVSTGFSILFFSYDYRSKINKILCTDLLVVIHCSGIVNCILKKFQPTSTVLL